MLRQKALKKQVDKNRLKAQNTILGKRDEKICSTYNLLFQRLRKINYYEYLTITAEDVNEWCSDKILSNETAAASRKRRQQFRENMIFPCISYYFNLW